MAKPYIIQTKLEGYVNAFKPSGKFNNCGFSFTIPDKDLDFFEDEYQKALKWGANKLAGKRHEKALQKWDESGLVKYSYGGPESSAPLFVWVDSKGEPVEDLDLREGTVVRLAIALKPYVYGNKVGLSLKVVGGQIIKAVTGSGSDAGSLDEEEVASLFGEVEGFDQSDPQYRPTEEQSEEDDDEDAPF
jgi:hypothetical protein